jgi:hypothetical protein
VTCYESAIEGDARTVLALLERRGIPSRLEPMGSSVFPQMGFAVLVPADRIDEAQELLDSETPCDAEASAASEPGGPDRGLRARVPDSDGARYSVFRYSMTARRWASVRWSPNGWPAFDWLQYVVS